MSLEGKFNLRAIHEAIPQTPNSRQATRYGFDTVVDDIALARIRHISQLECDTNLRDGGPT